MPPSKVAKVQSTSHCGWALEAGLEILELLARSEQELGVSDISRRLEMDKANAHRLLSVLKRRRLVDHNEENRRDRAGVEVLSMAQNASHAHAVGSGSLTAHRFSSSETSTLCGPDHRTPTQSWLSSQAHWSEMLTAGNRAALAARTMWSLASTNVRHFGRHHGHELDICLQRQASHVGDSTRHIAHIYSRFGLYGPVRLQSALFHRLGQFSRGVADVDLTASNVVFPAV